MTAAHHPTPKLAQPSLRDVPAPAKLNLFLHVVGQRDDGMHLLQSLFVLIDWGDTLHFTRRDDGGLTRKDLGATLPDNDLTLRAARALKAASGTRFGADIQVEKSVPWGAGLGGGSSDAASTLIALNRLWGLGLPRSRLAEIAAALGADVPFFIGGQNAIVQGIGDVLMPVSLPPRRFLVVKPVASLATADVFKHPAVNRDTPALTPTAILAGFTACDKNNTFGHNDLQSAAIALCPEVGSALTTLQRHVGHARMSGSGSAVFASFGESENVSDAPGSSLASMLEQFRLQGWTARVCRSLARHPLDDWVG